MKVDTSARSITGVRAVTGRSTEADAWTATAVVGAACRHITSARVLYKVPTRARRFGYLSAFASDYEKGPLPATIR